MTFDAKPDYTKEIFVGHSADEIKIIANNREMTLQAAINGDRTILCLGGPSTNFNINHGHDSYEISVNGETKTLQQAINAKNLCRCSTAPVFNFPCSKTCYNPGTYDCNGDCIASSPENRGQSCGVYSKCDGAGNCNLGTWVKTKNDIIEPKTKCTFEDPTLDPCTPISSMCSIKEGYTKILGVKIYYYDWYTCKSD